MPGSFDVADAVPSHISDVLAGRPLRGPVTQRDVDVARAFDIETLLLSEVRRQEADLQAKNVSASAAQSLLRCHRSKRAFAAVPDFLAIADKSGVEIGIFKGAALSNYLYEDSESRTFNDVDVHLSCHDHEALNALLQRLGRSTKSAHALTSLAFRGDHIHEIEGTVSGASFDLHFNPFGLVSPLRSPELVSEHATAREIVTKSGLTFKSASLELELAVSLINLIRRGGGALRFYADAARLLAHGDLRVGEFEELVRREGLCKLVKQALLSVQTGLRIEMPEGLEAYPAKHPVWWAPRIGEPPNPSLVRRGPFNVLRLDDAGIRELRSLVTWYCPTPLQRRARFG